MDDSTDTIMFHLNATPKKLRNGNWGCTVDGAAAVGALVLITARNGKSWEAYVSKVVWTDGRASICETSKTPVAAEATPTIVTPTKRTLSADGFISMDLDNNKAAREQQIALLRAFPGAYWHTDRTQWSVSLEIKDRPRVLELAERLGLDVAEELKTYTRPAHVDAAIERARAAGAYPFQLRGVEHLASRQYSLLGDDMGLGKTLQALMALPEQTSTLVVCPASLKRNWANEVKRWRPDLTPVVLKGKKQWRLPKPGEVVIVNYEMVPGKFEKDEKTNKLKLVRESMGLPENPKFIFIVDEAHRAKNYKTQRTQRITALADVALQTFFLTATPLLNKPFDLWGVLSAGSMQREVFGSWNKFINCFNGHKGHWGYEFGQPLPEVPERLRRVMLRRLKTEVLPDLPSKTYSWLEVPMPRELVRIADDLDGTWGRDSILPPFEAFSFLRAELAKSRIEAMLSWVEDAEEQDTPVLVFSAHRAPIDALADRPGWAVITGSTDHEERAQIVADFQAGKLKGVGLTIHAGGVGITLTQASTALFVDIDWNPNNNAQAEDRMVRIGQKASAVNIVRMVSDHPLDQHVCRLIVQKQELVYKAIEQMVDYKVPPEPTAKERAEYEARVQAAIAAAQAQAAQAAADEAKNKIAKALRNKARVELTQAKKEAIEKAVGYLARVCDGAVKKDDVGFNKADTARGHWLAVAGWENEDNYQLGYDMLRKYKGQIELLWHVIY